MGGDLAQILNRREHVLDRFHLLGTDKQKPRATHALEGGIGLLPGEAIDGRATSYRSQPEGSDAFLLLHLLAGPSRGQSIDRAECLGKRGQRHRIWPQAVPFEAHFQRGARPRLFSGLAGSHLISPVAEAARHSVPAATTISACNHSVSRRACWASMRLAYSNIDSPVHPDVIRAHLIASSESRRGSSSSSSAPTIDVAMASVPMPVVTVVSATRRVYRVRLRDVSLRGYPRRWFSAPKGRQRRARGVSPWGRDRDRAFLLFRSAGATENPAGPRFLSPLRNGKGALCRAVHLSRG